MNKPVRVVASSVVGNDLVAVTQHRDAVGESEDLLKEVRHDNDGRAVRGEPADHREEVLGVRFAKRRRWLVEANHLRATGERFQDLDLLRLPEREARDGGVEVKVEPALGDESFKPGAILRWPHDPRCVRPPPQVDVLKNRPGRHERELLRDQRDPVVDRGARTAEFRGAFVEENRSRVGRDRPAENLQQR